MSTKKVSFVRPCLNKPLMSHVHFLEVTGWVGRVPPGLKLFSLPFLVLKTRHPMPPIHASCLKLVFRFYYWYLGLIINGIKSRVIFHV